MARGLGAFFSVFPLPSLFLGLPGPLFLSPFVAALAWVPFAVLEGSASVFCFFVAGSSFGAWVAFSAASSRSCLSPALFKELSAYFSALEDVAVSARGALTSLGASPFSAVGFPASAAAVLLVSFFWTAPAAGAVC